MPDHSDSDADLDPVTLTIVWDRFEAICEEMGRTLERTGKSEAVCAGQDYSTALCDADGQVIAQGNFSPAHLGSMPYAVRHVLDYFDPGELEPGDAIILNDAFMGSGHMPDVFLVMPIFVDSAVAAFSATVAHHVDIGGMTPGSQAVEATEVYQEGLRLFPTRVIRDGEIQPWFERLVNANVRIPEKVIGDVQAQQNALHRGKVLFKDLVEEYGLATSRATVDEIYAETERSLRAEIEEIPDGEYRAEDYLDNYGEDTEPVKLVVTVRVDGDEITFDCSGTDPATPSAINSPINYTRAYLLFVTMGVTDMEIHLNQGLIKPLSFEVPEGSALNPQPPTATAARAIYMQRIVDVAMQAFAHAVPDRVVAASSHVVNPNYGGIDPESEEPFNVFDIIVGGIGGSDRKVGEEGVVPSFNISNIPVEVHEEDNPITVEQFGLVPDSGGAGRNRGALAVRKDVTLHADVTFTNLMDRTETPPPGLFGGEPGATARTLLNPADERRPLHPKGTFDLSAGDTISLQACGAGGYGSPMDRSPNEVLEDVRKGYVSSEQAREEYGVVVDDTPDGVELDEGATADLREE
jgi:N-methylhydantoinase B